MGDEPIDRYTTLARDKFIFPAIERALKDRPAPMPPIIFAQFLTLLDCLDNLYDGDHDKTVQQYRGMTEFALRKFFMERGLDADGKPDPPS